MNNDPPPERSNETLAGGCCCRAVPPAAASAAAPRREDASGAWQAVSAASAVPAQQPKLCPLCVPDYGGVLLPKQTMSAFAISCIRCFTVATKLCKLYEAGCVCCCQVVNTFVAGAPGGPKMCPVCKSGCVRCFRVSFGDAYYPRNNVHSTSMFSMVVAHCLCCFLTVRCCCIFSSATRLSPVLDRLSSLSLSSVRFYTAATRQFSVCQSFPRFKERFCEPWSVLC